MQDSNFIDGAWAPALGGDVFEAGLRQRSREESIWWPRSGARDLVAAVAGLRRASPAWRRRRPDERAELLSLALDRWHGNASGADQLAELLGLGEGALDDDFERALLTGDELIATAPIADHSDERPAVVRVSAAELYPGLVREVIGELLHGRSVLILSDPDLPWAAHELVLQLSSDKALAGVVALLHDDRRACTSIALKSSAFSRVYLPGVNPDRATGEVPRGLSVSTSQGFGVGVFDNLPGEEKNGPGEVILKAPANTSFVVLEGDDPAAAATEAYDRAFGAVRALSGQRAGQVGRVICHQRLFSTFTEALLERMERARDEVACRVFSSNLDRYQANLCRLGLDEGATLVLGGPEEVSGFRGGRQNGILPPSVFTNAEPTMGLSNAFRPAPVLSLIRASSDAAAHALSRRMADMATSFTGSVSLDPTSGPAKTTLSPTPGVTS